MIVNVPIESLEDRYSADWNKWFAAYVKANNIDILDDVRTIMCDPLRNKIHEGEFLDVVATTCFKAQQIDSISRLVDSASIPRNERVVFLIQDGWFPIEQLAYLRDMLGCHYWKFVGIFHAGTYSKWDATARNHMYVWGEDLENAWFKIYDRIIVGSEHHKLLLHETRTIPLHKITVIPWPVEVPELDTTHKKDIVVFPHRLNVEKQPELFLRKAHSLPGGWDMARTVDRCATKSDYYKLLAEAKIAVSLGLEELYGIAMVEAALLGCHVLVPDQFSYKEMFSKECRYADEKEFVTKLYKLMHSQRGSGYMFPDGELRFLGRSTSVSFYDKLFAVLGEV